MFYSVLRGVSYSVSGIRFELQNTYASYGMSNASEARPPGPQFRNVFLIQQRLQRTPVGTIILWLQNCYFESNGIVNPFYKNKLFVGLLNDKNRILSFLWEAEEILIKCKVERKMIEAKNIKKILYFCVGFLSNHPEIIHPAKDMIPCNIFWIQMITTIISPYVRSEIFPLYFWTLPYSIILLNHTRSVKSISYLRSSNSRGEKYFIINIFEHKSRREQYISITYNSDVS